jgi:hypothetical protein
LKATNKLLRNIAALATRGRAIVASIVLVKHELEGDARITGITFKFMLKKIIF